VVHLSLQFGLPGETIETTNETIDWVKSAQPSEITVSFSTLYPGAELTHQFARGQWKPHRKVVITEDYRQLDAQATQERLSNCIHGVNGVLSPIVTGELIEHVTDRVWNELPDLYQPGAGYRRNQKESGI
jgi:hypothetical protein